MTLLKSLWQGDVPLVKTFWLYNELVWILLEPVGGTLVFLTLEMYPPSARFLEATMPAFALIAYCYLLFISVATWRAANKYKGWFGWARAARLLVIVQVGFPFVVRIFEWFVSAVMTPWLVGGR